MSLGCSDCGFGPTMSHLGQSRLGGASCTSSHVRNAPLATVGPKKAACRDGPEGDIDGLGINSFAMAVG